MIRLPRRVLAVDTIALGPDPTHPYAPTRMTLRGRRGELVADVRTFHSLRSGLPCALQLDLDGFNSMDDYPRFKTLSFEGLELVSDGTTAHLLGRRRRSALELLVVEAFGDERRRARARLDPSQRHAWLRELERAEQRIRDERPDFLALAAETVDPALVLTPTSTRGVAEVTVDSAAVPDPLGDASLHDLREMFLPLLELDFDERTPVDLFGRDAYWVAFETCRSLYAAVDGDVLDLALQERTGEFSARIRLTPAGRAAWRKTILTTKPTNRRR